MPLYDFICPKCGHKQTELEPRPILVHEYHPKCEECDAPCNWLPSGGPAVKCDWHNPVWGDNRPKPAENI